MRLVKSALVISDIHLGRPSSYLYSNHSVYQANRRALLHLLRQLGAHDELVLNGDIMELSLSGWDEIVRETSLFFEVLAEAGPFKRIVYIPGNHDHHFWRLLVEKIFLLHNIENKISLPDLDRYPYHFVDQIFSSKSHDIILNHFWPAGTTAPEIVVKYPNHLLQIKNSAAGNQTYLITHGHFLEDLFRPMNILIEPARLDELEAFNNIWLEAFHYHLGQAGRLSSRVRNLLASYEKGGRPAQQVIKKVLEEIYARVDRKYPIIWPINWILRYTIKKVVKKLTLSRHSELFGAALNTNLKKNIKQYIYKYLLSRYKKVLKGDYQFPGDSDIPLPFIFLFGHTHRPILDQDKEAAWIEIDGRIYPLINSGGWLRSDIAGNVHGQNAGVVQIEPDGWKWHSFAGQLK
jgi:hypothetical protein